MRDNEEQDQDDVRAAMAIVAAPIKRFGSRLGRTRIDPSRTATAMAALDEDFAAQPPSAWMTAFRAVLIDVGEPSTPSPRQKPQKVPRWARALVGYFEALDQQWPMASSFVMKSAGFAERDFTQTFFESAGHMCNAARQRRERRSVSLRSAFHVLVEGPYYTLINALFRAECLKRQRKVKAKRGTEQLRLVVQWCPPDLVDPLASDYRNAVAHNDWHYRPATDEIELRDRDGQRMLLAKNLEMYQRGKRLVEDVMSLYVLGQSSVGTRILKTFVDAGVADALADPSKSAEVEERLLAGPVGSTYATLQRLGLDQP